MYTPSARPRTTSEQIKSRSHGTGLYISNADVADVMNIFRNRIHVDVIQDIINTHVDSNKIAFILQSACLDSKILDKLVY